MIQAYAHIILMVFIVLISPPSTATEVFTNQTDQAIHLRDNDRDGVINRRDRCKNTALNNAPIDIYGCTINSKLLLSVELEILFETGKYDVKPRYYDEIQKISDFLNVHPNTKAYINGHTDNIGDALNNKELSLNRAAAVAKVLVSQFQVDPSRVLSTGYGETNPIADNNTPSGRAQNRRVIAEVYSRSRHDVQRWDIYNAE